MHPSAPRRHLTFTHRRTSGQYSYPRRRLDKGRCAVPLDASVGSFHDHNQGPILQQREQISMAGKKSQHQAAIDKTPADREVALNALRTKIAELRASLKHLMFEKAKPHSWMTYAERAEIIHLHQMGHRSSKISTVTGRSISTIGKTIRRYRKFMALVLTKPDQ